jgi:RNA polymerase sigma-70 factor (ECF subfamily)
MKITVYVILISMNIYTSSLLERLHSRDYWLHLMADAMAKDNTEEADISEDEENLPQLFLKGSEDAFEKIVQKYKKLVYYAAFHILRNSEAALDATQEVFLKTYKSIATFRGQSKLKTWIYRITVNHCLNTLRSMSRTKGNVSLDETIEVADSSKENPRKNLENAELKEKIEWAIQQLPAKQRVIFILRNYNDLTFEEIADSLKKSTGGVKANYFHAVRKMRDLLSAQGTAQ